MIDDAANKKLSKLRALVVGCGGLGCYVTEHLARMNVKKIIACDNDTFSMSNLNRQLYADYNSLCKLKVSVAAARAADISRETFFIAVPERITKENIDVFPINGEIDVVFDCGDNIEISLLLEEYAAKKGVPLIHGAINGFAGQIAVVMPGEFTLKKLYSAKSSVTGATLSHVPATLASLMVNEAVKITLGKGEALTGGKLLIVDLLNNSYEIIQI